MNLTTEKLNDFMNLHEILNKKNFRSSKQLEKQKKKEKLSNFSTYNFWNFL